MNLLTYHFLSILRVPAFNRIVFKIRLFWFLKIKRSLVVFSDTNSVLAHDYSIDMLLKGKTSDRPLKLISPLSTIDEVNKKGSTLSIGSRYETELLYLIGYGFNPNKVKGLDMISYSPLINVGNMHKIPQDDSSIDTVILGWVLPYSSEPQVAANEVVRISKNHGIVAIAFTGYSKDALADMAKSNSNAVNLEARINSTEHAIQYFANHVDKIFFRQDPENRYEGTCAIIFSIKK